jgi:putative transposase
MLYESRKDAQEPLRRRLREIAATYVRYGYRRLTVLLRREGWKVNAKRVYRLYEEENLKVRSVERKKIARRQRVPPVQAMGPDEGWSADFVSDKLTDGRSIRILTVIDQFTRECVWLEADRSMSGPKVVAALTRYCGAGRNADKYDSGQRQRVRRASHGGMGDCRGCPAVFHPAGQTGRERIHRKLQRETA